MNLATEAVGEQSFAMKRIATAIFAKEVTRGFGVELVFGQRVVSGQQTKPANETCFRGP
jgi:hypothetical protein